jgi:hypothetical protein
VAVPQKEGVMRNVWQEKATPKPAVDIYYEEFKFLGWIVPDRNKVEFICVERIDLELLEVVPSLMGNSTIYHVRVYFIAKDSSKMTELQPTKLVRFGKFSFFRFSTWFRRYSPGVSVGQALMDLCQDDLQKLSHVVVVTGPTLWPKIQIFKLPKSFSLQKWIEQEKIKLRSQIIGQESA